MVKWRVCQINCYQIPTMTVANTVSLNIHSNLRTKSPHLNDMGDEILEDQIIFYILNLLMLSKYFLHISNWLWKLIFRQ